jgi:hypothetical protein
MLGMWPQPESIASWDPATALAIGWAWAGLQMRSSSPAPMSVGHETRPKQPAQVAGLVQAAFPGFSRSQVCFHDTAHLGVPPGLQPHRTHQRRLGHIRGPAPTGGDPGRMTGGARGPRARRLDVPVAPSTNAPGRAGRENHQTGTHPEGKARTRRLSGRLRRCWQSFLP